MSDILSVLFPSAALPGQLHLVPIFEAAYKNETWWPIPASKSWELYLQSITGSAIAHYSWGERSYVVDFESRVQVNVDSQRIRSIRLVWTTPDEATAKWTGQIPMTRSWSML